ncbi:MAG: glycosyltransferase family 4 protein [Mycobacterium sp.]
MTAAPMRVGLVVPRFAPYRGGVETYTANAAGALAAKGVAVTVITQVARDARLPRAAECDGYTVERYRLPVDDVFDLPSPSAVRAASRRGRFEVLWVHGYHTPLAWLAAERAHVPVVFTPHYHGDGHTALRRVLHRVYRPAGRRLMAASRRIVVDTAAEAELVLRDFPRHIHRESISVIPPAVVDPIGGRPPYPTLSPVVLTVARQEPYKRTDILIRAIAQLHRRGVAGRLVVVGHGSGLVAYRELAARLGVVDDAVTFTGAVDDEELRRWWASASLYVTASEKEAFGIGLAQALTAGLPVVASEIPAHREVIGNAGSEALAQLCDDDGPEDDTVSRYAAAMAGFLSAADSRKQRAACCGFPTAQELDDQLLQTLNMAAL